MEIRDAAHQGCRIGKGDKVLLWTRVIADYRCNACGGRLLYKADYESSPARYYVQCFNSDCGEQDNVIHWRTLEKQRLDALEVAASLPPDLQEALGGESGYDFEARDLIEARAILKERNAGGVEVEKEFATRLKLSRDMASAPARDADKALAYGHRVLRGEE